MNHIDLLSSGLKQLGIEPTAAMLMQFEKYFSLLVEWNEKMNLTSIIEEEDVIIKHFLDSVLIVKAVDFKGDKRLLDVGTGAGFPGLPLKILFPHLKVVLLDAVNKKLTFLKEVCEKLELKDVTFLHGRAEDFAKDPIYREEFDFVVSRAVSNLATLSEYCLPFTNIDRLFIAYKSVDSTLEVEDSLNAIRVMGGDITRIETYKIPNSEIERTYVLITKSKITPNIYPRKAGLPAKKPL